MPLFFSMSCLFPEIHCPQSIHPTYPFFQLKPPLPLDFEFPDSLWEGTSEIFGESMDPPSVVDADAFSDGVRTPVWVSSGGSPEFSSLAEPDFFDGEFFGVEILERALTPLFPTGDEISPAVGPNTVHSHDLLTPLIPMAQLTIPGQSDPPNPSPANQNPPGEGDSPEHLAGTQGSDGSADGQGGGAGGGGGGGTRTPEQ